MKRWLALPILAAAMALFPMAAAADEGEGGGGQGGDEQGQGDSNQFGPFKGTSTDSGTCGNDWAHDTFQRRFFVQQNDNGTTTLRETFNGTFLTIGGPSPGGCETSSPHGLTVLPLKTGPFAGFLSGTVTGATMYNPDGCAAAGTCNTTAGFLVAVFGPTAKYSCATGPGACTFFFDYHARDQGLRFHHWINASKDLGGNRGDIATV